jgi:hypothetical protein
VAPARRISTTEAARICAVCERTLLVGERAVRYAPDGETFVDVCPLCQEIAVEEGWLKEGSPTTPLVPDEPRRRRFSLSSLFEQRRRDDADPVAPEPILRRLSDTEQAMVEAAELFNASAFRRTIAGIAKSLGEPRVSVLPLPGVNIEVVLTIAWDISWYQYRVTPESAQPVRLEERGYEIGELDSTYKEWNAHLEPDGRLVPDLPRL